MKKLFALFAALMLVFAACGDSGGGDSCESVADDAIGLIQDILDDVEDLSLEDLQNFGDEPPASFQALESQGEELQATADSLGCSDEEMSSLVQGKLGDLEARGTLGELLLAQFQEEGLFDTP